MLMRDSNNGVFVVYDISNDAITKATDIGQVGLEWTVAGFGDFSGRSGETDMLMRDSYTGQFEVYDIGNNAVTSAASMGQVGLQWQVGGIAADPPPAASAASIALLAQAMASFDPIGAVSSAPSAILSGADILQRVIPGRRSEAKASPESITPASGYGFRALDPRPSADGLAPE
jgi:hypothetical protein